MTTATRITYGKRITPICGDHRRWCSICGTQRATVRGVFVTHQRPDGKPCGNSGVKVNNTESVG